MRDGLASSFWVSCSLLEVWIRQVGSLLLRQSEGSKGSSTVEAVAERLSVAPGGSVQGVAELLLVWYLWWETAGSPDPEDQPSEKMW